MLHVLTEIILSHVETIYNSLPDSIVGYHYHSMCHIIIGHSFMTKINKLHFRILFILGLHCFIIDLLVLHVLCLMKTAAFVKLISGCCL